MKISTGERNDCTPLLLRNNSCRHRCCEIPLEAFVEDAGLPLLNLKRKEKLMDTEITRNAEIGTQNENTERGIREE